MNTQTARAYPAIDWLRMPLAVCVIFIHSFGTKQPNYSLFKTDPWSWEAIYNAVRIFLSHEFPIFAVPAFFLISGFLFFKHLEQWHWPTYGNKLRKRLSTILLPYIGWNIFHCVHLCWPTLMKIAHGTTQWDALWRLTKALGGWHMLWTGSYHNTVTNCLGMDMTATAPVLVPLWFLRDLMVVILFAPLIHWLLRTCGKWTLAVLGVCLVANVWLPIPGFSIVCTFWFALGGYFTLSQTDMVECCYRLRRPLWTLWTLALLLSMCKALYWPEIDHYLAWVISKAATLVAVPAVIAVAAARQAKGRIVGNRWLAESAFFVYCSHIFLRKQVVKATLPLVPHAYPAYLIHYLLVPLLTLVLCLIVRQLWQTAKGWVTAKMPTQP